VAAVTGSVKALPFFFEPSRAVASYWHWNTPGETSTHVCVDPSHCVVQSPQCGLGPVPSTAVSHPFVTMLSQLANPGVHWSIAQAPFAHFVVPWGSAPLGLQLLLQRPQLSMSSRT
jgi:hypothetical protein